MTKLNWRDASKVLPEDGIPCLAIDRDMGFVIACYYSYFSRWEFYIAENISCDIEHWLPLNEIPLPGIDIST